MASSAVSRSWWSYLSTWPVSSAMALRGMPGVPGGPGVPGAQSAA